MNVPAPFTFIFTCEHGGNRIPAAYRALFTAQQTLLASHRGYDPGALTMARELTNAFSGTLVSAEISRLLVDLNRSLGHRRLFSEATRTLPAPERDAIVAHYYTPYRTQVERLVEQALSGARRVLHISAHSFTPELNGHVRRADVGLLYDQGRAGEVELCAGWKAALARMAPELHVRRNYPYAGKEDGLTSCLRSRFPADVYLGIELEINQNIVMAEKKRWTALRALLIESLRMTVAPSRTAQRPVPR